MTRARDLADGIFEQATGGVLKLETSDTTVTDGSVLGKIEFKAPDEASGTDAILVGAAIEAVAEGTFAADNNATELVFKTGASEAATTKMTLTSDGSVGIGTSSPDTQLVVANGNDTLKSNLDNDSIDFFASGKTFNLGTTSNNVVRFFSNNAERMRIDSGSNLSVGTTGNVNNTVAAGFQVQHLAGNGTTINIGHPNAAGDGYSFALFSHNNSVIGSIGQSSTDAVAYNTSSDYRLKTDAQPMTGASARVLALKPVNFEWIKSGSRTDGFLAHEAQVVVPECVSGTKDGMRDEEYEVTPATETEEAVMATRSVPDMQGIDQSKLVPLLVASLQEALARITVLENA